MNIQHVTQIETLFKKLYQIISSTFSESELDEITDFIDVGEYGVALETLCFIISEENKAINRDMFDLIEMLGSVMGMDPETWDFVKHRIKN